MIKLPTTPTHYYNDMRASPLVLRDWGMDTCPPACRMERRVAKLYSLGTAIVPQVGALVVRSLMEAYGLA